MCRLCTLTTDVNQAYTDTIDDCKFLFPGMVETSLILHLLYNRDF